MEDWLLANGYPALFLLSFLASTLLPLGSEWLLIVLLNDGFLMIPVVSIATAGNVLGAMTTYGIGLWGGPFLFRKVLRVSAEGQHRAERFFNAYGSWALLFSWLPVVGDPLCLAGGVLKTRPWRFVLLVTVGKLIRYLIVAELFLRSFAAG